ncbi:hypothetical protein D9757_009151 [Collybiopsis confluens]|uniref:Uncharacterized protein n=1 Tax=Collybiopsis confluens TaxID=2823264 RepID=A0A8H5H7V1_9AGAR|nr:hypothetical protein D9757_009151 [Collybiopsis confluens]
MFRPRPFPFSQTRSILHLYASQSSSLRATSIKRQSPRVKTIPPTIHFRPISSATSPPDSEDEPSSGSPHSDPPENERTQRLRRMAETDIIPKELDLFAFATAELLRFELVISPTLIWRILKLFFLTPQNDYTRKLWQDWKSVYRTVQSDRQELRQLNRMLGGLLDGIIAKTEEQVRGGKKFRQSIASVAYQDYRKIKDDVDAIDVAIRLAFLLQSWAKVWKAAKFQYAETRKAVGLPPDRQLEE